MKRKRTPHVYTQPHISPEWKLRYSRKQSMAKFRSEGWDFTLDTWYDLWETSGYMRNHGNTSSDIVLARIDSSLPWSPSNTIFCYRGDLKAHYSKIMMHGEDVVGSIVQHAQHIPEQSEELAHEHLHRT